MILPPLVFPGQTDHVLALATLGGEIKNRNDPISVALTKVAKASTVSCCCHCCYRAKLRQWKHCVRDILHLSKP